MSELNWFSRVWVARKGRKERGITWPNQPVRENLSDQTFGFDWEFGSGGGLLLFVEAIVEYCQRRLCFFHLCWRGRC